MPSPDNAMEDNLGVKTNVEDDWNLWDILPLM